MKSPKHRLSQSLLFLLCLGLFFENCCRNPCESRCNFVNPSIITTFLCVVSVLFKAEFQVKILGEDLQRAVAESEITQVLYIPLQTHAHRPGLQLQMLPQSCVCSKTSSGSVGHLQKYSFNRTSQGGF